MIDKKELKEVLNSCLTTGADFSEIYFESTISNSLEMVSSKINDVSTSNLYGAGIRILKENNFVYGYTNDITKSGLMNLANELKNNFNEKQVVFAKDLVEENHENIHKIKELSKNISNSEKIKLLEIASNVITNYDKRILQAIVSFLDSTQDILVVNSEGRYIKDVRNYQRLYATAVAKENDNMQRGLESIAGNVGIEFFTNDKIEKISKEAAQSAINMLDAKDMVGGIYDVVVHNAFGGVIFHEACGHPLESTSVSKNLSVFSNKLGQKIASECVTAIDDPTIENEWGSINIDDEGNLTKKIVLIEKGILKSYMIDKLGARRMDCDHTSSARRQSYKYPPTSRMSNTYIANGEHEFEDIIKNTKYGLFAKKMGGGSVNTTTGEYNFSVSEGYIIENGKITYPVKGATLIGSGATTLMNIDMVANNMSQAPGLCGAASGSIPTNVGQPTIRVKNMTVGGTGGKS